MKFSICHIFHNWKFHHFTPILQILQALLIWPDQLSAAEITAGAALQATSPATQL
jgi:hypothetical protein